MSRRLSELAGTGQTHVVQDLGPATRFCRLVHVALNVVPRAVDASLWLDRRAARRVCRGRGSDPERTGDTSSASA